MPRNKLSKLSTEQMENWSRRLEERITLLEHLVQLIQEEQDTGSVPEDGGPENELKSPRRDTSLNHKNKMSVDEIDCKRTGLQICDEVNEKFTNIARKLLEDESTEPNSVVQQETNCENSEKNSINIPTEIEIRDHNASNNVPLYVEEQSINLNIAVSDETGMAIEKKEIPGAIVKIEETMEKQILLDLLQLRLVNAGSNNTTKSFLCDLIKNQMCKTELESKVDKQTAIDVYEHNLNPIGEPTDFGLRDAGTETEGIDWNILNYNKY